jgi:hypothetical protein
MATSIEVMLEAEELKGKRTGYTYSDLARILRRCDCEHVGSKGSHRTWHHKKVTQHLTLIEAGSGEVLTVYIVKTRKYLLSIAEIL